MQKILFFLPVLLVLLTGTRGEAFPGVLQKVISGDTIIVQEDATEAKLVIRLYGIDAPDAGQPDYGVAKEYLSTLLSKTNDYLNIVPVFSRPDRFGRIQAFVYKDDVEINTEMVRTGLARVYEPECGLSVCGKLQRAQAAAREERRGIWWLGENAAKPWEARRTQYLQHANPKEGSYEGIFYFTDAKGRVIAADPEIKYVQYIHITPPPTKVYVPVPSGPPANVNNFIIHK